MWQVPVSEQKILQTILQTILLREHLHDDWTLSHPTVPRRPWGRL